MSAIAQSLYSAIGSRARDWARKRQGIDPASAHLTGNRIYILPTRAGLIFGLIVFTMLLGAMNYNNNMGFALTFLLAGIGVISIHHCHRNIADIYLHYLGGHPVFAGENLQFRFVIENRSTYSRWQIRLDWPDGTRICNELQPAERHTLTLAVGTTARGHARLPRIQLSTRFPLGLLRAWAWVHMDCTELVYPRPADQKSDAGTGRSAQMTSGFDRKGEDDFFGLRDYRFGDAPKHIAWKALARTGETLVTEYRSGSTDLVWIDWDDFPGADTEGRLAKMTRLLLDTEHDGEHYGLRMPGIEIAPAANPDHRYACLKAMALFDIRADA
ncbi:MAG: DUF58 domain-containing protein [Gammaproteobacteria bacterium]|nr:MAG: DUF58 domain-containing protein [Gammaproteobacteria bacterium]